MEFDKNKIKTKISIAKIKEENDIIMEKKKTRNVLKTVATVLGGIVFGTGVVFAGTKVYENVEKVWNTPKTYEFTEKLSEEDRKDAISEDEAKKKAIDYLGKIGLTKEISAIDLRKNILLPLKMEKSLKRKLLWCCYFVAPYLMAVRDSYKFKKNIQTARNSFKE